MKKKMLRLTSRHNQPRTLHVLSHNQLHLRAYNIKDIRCEKVTQKMVAVDMDGGPFLALNQLWKVDKMRYRITSFDQIEFVTHEDPQFLSVVMSVECIDG